MLWCNPNRIYSIFYLNLKNGAGVLMAHRQPDRLIGSLAGKNLVRDTYLLNRLRTRLRVDNRVRGEALVNIARSRIEVSQHRYKSITCPICSLNQGPPRSNIMDAQANAPRMLANQSTILQRVIDTCDTVLLHGEQEAG